MFHPTIIERIIEEFPKKAIKHQLAFACTHCNSTGLDPETRQTCQDCNGMGVCEWRSNGMGDWLRPMLERLYQEARREALQEMDMCRSMQLGETETAPEWSMKLLKLRMEYQKPN